MIQRYLLRSIYQYISISRRLSTFFTQNHKFSSRVSTLIFLTQRQAECAHELPPAFCNSTYSGRQLPPSDQSRVYHVITLLFVYRWGSLVFFSCFVLFFLPPTTGSYCVHVCSIQKVSEEEVLCACMIERYMRSIQQQRRTFL